MTFPAGDAGECATIHDPVLDREIEVHGVRSLDETIYRNHALRKELASAFPSYWLMPPDVKIIDIHIKRLCQQILTVVSVNKAESRQLCLHRQTPMLPVPRQE
jgi:hypothetical protein